MVPEVTRVPLVFIGAGLPEGDEHDILTAGVDIAPTLLSALQQNVPTVDGCDLWTDIPSADRTSRSEFWLDKDVRGRSVTVYRATSKWSDRGGVVYHHPPRLPRVAYALYAHLYSEVEATTVLDRASLGSVTNIAKLYASTVNRFGDAPDLDVDDLKEIDAAPSPKSSHGKEYYTEDQLRYLGYIE